MLQYEFFSRPFLAASPPPLFLSQSCSTFWSMHAILWKLQYFSGAREMEFCLSLLQASLVVQILNESEHTKLMTLLIINLPLTNFYRQLLLWEGIDKSQCEPDSPSSYYFPLLPPLQLSFAQLFCNTSSLTRNSVGKFGHTSIDFLFLNGCCVSSLGLSSKLPTCALLSWFHPFYIQPQNEKRFILNIFAGG